MASQNAHCVRVSQIGNVNACGSRHISYFGEVMKIPSDAQRPLSPRVYRVPSRIRLSTLFAGFLAVLCCLSGSGTLHAQTFGCSPAMANDIVCENSKPGNDPSQ